MMKTFISDPNMMRCDTMRCRRPMTMMMLPVLLMLLLLCGCGADKQHPDAAADLEVGADSLETAAFDDDFALFEDDYQQQQIVISDPLEPINRFMFAVNDTLYFWILKPLASLTELLIPEPIRVGASNFFHNLATPVSLVSCLLQGDFDGAGVEVERFIINSTVGILGVFDPAKDEYGLEPVRSDLGQTLAAYGFEHGFYLVLPLLGPSSARDGVGLVGGIFLDPVYYVNPTELSLGISGGRYINRASLSLGEYESFKASAVDFYIAMRQAYLQYRRQLTEKGKTADD